MVLLPDKAAVFIDGGYAKVRKQLGFSQKDVDYAVFSDKLCRSCERFRTYYYDCMPYKDAMPSSDDENRYKQKQRFIESLRYLDRFEIRLGHLLKVNATDFKQKGVDIQLSIDLTRLCWQDKVEMVILVTADTDFIPAIQEAKNAGVTAVLAYCPNMNKPISKALYQICDERLEITANFLNGCVKATA
jgi:uncharacterized LabA/DUF88 family protein